MSIKNLSLFFVGPSLHFLRDTIDFEIAIAYFNEARFSFRIHNAKSVIFSGLGIVGFFERTEKLEFCRKLRRRSPTKSANSGANKIKRIEAKISKKSEVCALTTIPQPWFLVLFIKEKNRDFISNQILLKWTKINFIYKS